MELTVKTEMFGAAAWVTLNRPRKKNAFDGAMMELLEQTIRELEADSSVRVIILSGAGHCFCSGGDLSTMLDGTDPRTVAERQRDLASCGAAVRAIRDCSKPVIAMVEGYAIGGGFAIALACDVIFAAESARFSSNFLHVGLAPEMGTMYLLTQVCGPYRAKELWLSGRRIGAAEAESFGIVSRVLPEDSIADETRAFADLVAGLPQNPVSIMKRCINSGALSSLGAALAADMQNLPVCWQDEECQSYMASHFRKKP